MNLNVKKMSLQQGLFKELAFTSQSPESSLMITDSFVFIKFNESKPLHNRILQRDKVMGDPMEMHS